MTTRCQIAFYYSKPDINQLKNYNAIIYRHADGYPEDKGGVIDSIMPFLEFYKNKSGIGDSEYCAARLLQYLCNENDVNYKKEVDLTGITGYGITNYISTDISYYYAIYPNSIDVYNVCNDNPEQWEKIESHIIRE